MLQSKLGYNAVNWRIYMMAAGSNFALKTAAKPLQIEHGYY